MRSAGRALSCLLATLLLAGCATTFRHPQTGEVRECAPPSILTVLAGAADVASMALGGGSGYFAGEGAATLLGYHLCAGAAREAGYETAKE